MTDCVLVPPVVESAGQTGIILDVERLSVDDPAESVSLLCTDGARLRIPDSLFGWAASVIDDNFKRRAEGSPSLFPVQIEFGTLNGMIYAEVL
ncbi:hypothetical protein ACFVMC_30165 [Nocardia sp. NPDC127579]|uniref:hypothetical protein n=1 Tax=Nocardia sp. NPDC127579 TaxID=3345402 RepID=UPI00362FA606